MIKEIYNKDNQQEYEIKTVGSYLQDLGRYMIEHPDMILSIEIKYNTEELTHRSYISYENPAKISFTVRTL